MAYLLTDELSDMLVQISVTYSEMRLQNLTKDKQCRTIHVWDGLAGRHVMHPPACRESLSVSSFYSFMRLSLERFLTLVKLAGCRYTPILIPLICQLICGNVSIVRRRSHGQFPTSLK